MKQVMLLVVVLLATRLADAFTNTGPLSVNGIYNGRFGIEKNVQAVFDMGGVRGYVQFIQEKPGDPVEINVNLAGLDQYSDPYPWRIHTYPARFALLEDYPCGESLLGGVYDTDPVDDGAVGDLYAIHGGIRHDMPIQTFMNTNITLCGPESIIGRSLRIDRGNNEWICANIQYHGARVERLRATFDFDSSDIQGDVIITKVIGRDDASVEVDVVKRRGEPPALESVDHQWGIYHGPCSNLSLGLYGETTTINQHVGIDPFRDCGPNAQRHCPIGDLASKCGNLSFSDMGRSRAFCTDNQLGVTPCSYFYKKKDPHTVTSLVIRDVDANNTILGCSQLGAPAPPQVAQCTFQFGPFYGDVLFYQASPYDKTRIKTFITGINGRDVGLVIREGPVPDDYNCNELGPILRKNRGAAFFPGPVEGGIKTGDRGVLGSLAGILDIPPGAFSHRVKSTTDFLPLFGQCSIIGHSLVLVDADGTRLGCCTIKRTSIYSDSEIASLLGFQNAENPPAGK